MFTQTNIINHSTLALKWKNAEKERVERQINCRLILVFFALFFTLATVSASPLGTTYQARIVKPDGNPLESANVNFKFTVLNPAATCILYAETFSAISMSETSGIISFTLGSGVKTYPVSATTFADAFNNSTPTLSCDAGGPPSFSPAATDVRKIVMQFNDGAGWQTLPAMAINAVPYSIYAGDALRLGGVSATNFVQYSTIPTCTASEALRYNGTGFNCVNVVSGGGGASGTITSADVTTALGYTPANSSTVATSFTTVANSLNTVGTSFATVTSTLNSLGSSITAITSSQWVSSGTTISYSAGNIGIGTITPITKLEVSGGVKISMESATCATSYAGTLRYNAGAVEFCNGTAWSAFGVAGAGITTLNGSTSGTQSFVTGSGGIAPSISSINGIHTFSIPLAASSSVTAGLLSNSDYVNFSNKITSSAASIAQVLGYVPAASGAVPSGVLLSANNLSDLASSASARTNLGLGTFAIANSIDLGSASATGTLAADRLPAFGGDVTSVSGSAVLTLVNSGVISGTYSKVSVNDKGRVTSGAQLALSDVTTALGYTPASATASSQWNTSGTTINYLVGNVGIGRTNPTAALTVSGSIVTGDVSSTASGLYAVAMGANNVATGINSVAIGGSNSAVNNFSTAIGNGNTASGHSSVALGFDNTTTGFASFAVGDTSIADQYGAMALGVGVEARGYASIAMGELSVASGSYSFAAGEGNVAADDYAIAMGSYSTAAEYGSLAIGESAQALNQYAIAMGTSSVASGFTSVAIGKDVTAHSYAQISLGRQNMPKGGENPNSWIWTDPIFAIGNGTGTGASRSTALMILKNGNTGIGLTAPTAFLHVKAGTSSVAALKLSSGTLLTSPESGTIEYDGSNLYYTDGTSTRRTIATATASGSYTNVGSLENSSGNINLVPNAAGSVIVSATTASTNSQTGALIVKGGLGVAGNIYSSGTIITSSNMQGASITATSGIIAPYIYGSTLANGDLILDSTTNATKGNILLAPDGGNVGIGAANPSEKLHVSGGASGTAGTIARFKGNSSWGSIDFYTMNTSRSFIGDFNVMNSMGWDTASNYLQFLTGGNERVRIDNQGKMGIGTAAPVAKLDVSGSIRMAYDATTCNSSFKGTMRFSSTDNIFEMCDGTSWNTIASADLIPASAIVLMETCPSGWTDTGLAQATGPGAVTCNGITCRMCQTPNASLVPANANMLMEACPTGWTNLGRAIGQSAAGYALGGMSFGLTTCKSPANNSAMPKGTRLLMQACPVSWNDLGDAGTGPFAANCPTAACKVCEVPGGTTNVRLMYGGSASGTTLHGPEVAIIGGRGGSSSGTGGAVYLRGGLAYDGAGGEIVITAGNGAVSGAGGSVTISTGMSPSTSAYANMILNSNGGRVGIGTALPLQKFEVVGTESASQVVTRIANLAGTANTQAVISLDTTNNGFNVRDSQIRATNNGANQTTLEFYTSNATTPAEAMRITSDGYVGIGTVTPAQTAEIDGPWGFNNSAPQISGTTQKGILRLGANSGANGEVLDFGFNVNTTSGYAWLQATNRTNLGVNYNMALNPNGGNVGIGTTSPARNLVVAEQTGGSTRGISARTYAANSGGVIEVAGALGTPASPTALTSGKSLGFYIFSGHDGTDITMQSTPTGMWSIATENWSSTARGANIVFGTTATGTNNGVERMRIDQNGNVGIGTTSPGNKLEVNGNILTQTGSIGTNLINGSFGNNTNRAYLSSTGYIWSTMDASAISSNLYLHRNNTSDYFVQFGYGASTVGSISTNGSSVAYNTTSDYRLKENIIPMQDALSRFLHLQPKRFNYKTRPQETIDGFIAHEVAEVVPEAVTGKKDAVDKGGHILPQLVDYSKVIPLVAGAVREIAEVIDVSKADKKNPAITVDSSSNVGIGNSSPSYTLDVNGTARVTGSVAAWSDIRTKKNIEVIPDSLKKILQIRGVTFDWRNDEFPDKKFKTTRDIGVIAQEVEKVFPEVVQTDRDSYKSVAYSQLVAPLIEAVKELYYKMTGVERKVDRAIASLEEKKADKFEVDALKAENADLKQRLERLEKMMLNQQKSK